MTTTIELLLHYVGSIEYRFLKAIKNCDPTYSTFELGEGVRSPIAILNHMNHVMEYAIQHLKEPWPKNLPIPELLDWEAEVNRFQDQLKKLQILLKERQDSSVDPLKIILQGPLSDVMTHIGQLAMLRRVNGKPIPGENFMKAPINSNPKTE